MTPACAVFILFFCENWDLKIFLLTNFASAEGFMNFAMFVVPLMACLKHFLSFVVDDF